MPDRFEYAPHLGDAVLPLVCMLDAVQLGQNASLAAAGVRVGNTIECSGMRRYRVKCLQLTGAGPTLVEALDLPFAPNAANAWQVAVLAAAQPTVTRSVYNFGEGTAVLTNFMGPYVAIRLTNNGADAATYEIELWMQG